MLTQSDSPTVLDNIRRSTPDTVYRNIDMFLDAIDLEVSMAVTGASATPADHAILAQSLDRIARTQHALETLARVQIEVCRQKVQRIGESQTRICQRLERLVDKIRTALPGDDDD